MTVPVHRGPSGPASGAETGPHGLTHRQYRQLLKAINEARVLRLRGKEYLATWDVEAHLTRIFGPGGWDDDVVVPPTLIFEDSQPRRRADGELDTDRHGEPILGWYVAYRCTVRLTVRNIGGEQVATHTGDSTGSADNQPDRAAAHDLALKSAASGALKRAAVKLGDQFGLSLYAGTHKAVVGATLVWTDPEAGVAGRDGGHDGGANGVAVVAFGEDDAGVPSVGTGPVDPGIGEPTEPKAPDGASAEPDQPPSKAASAKRRRAPRLAPASSNGPRAASPSGGGPSAVA